MGLRTWWLENRVERTGRKLRRLRHELKLLREREQELARDKKNGLPQAELEARDAKLHADRERATAEISRLMAEEEQLKRELKDSETPVSAS